MNVAVIGTGYVGLVAGACLADMGNRVICVDKDEDKLNYLKSGVIPIYEPKLDELVKNNIDENRLSFISDIKKAVNNSKVIFIAVGTPQNSEGDADLSSVFSVAEDISKSLNEYKVIVIKSTVPVGTAEKVSEIIRRNTNCEFDVVSNPEFLKQGHAVDDFQSPDRVIIGSNSDKALKIMQEIYSPYMRTSNRVVSMDVKSAEMTKYASNAYLAARISFINEISNLCEKVGADIENVRIGMSTDSRIGDKFLFPGIGYGGSCFPKDIKALIKTGAENNCEMKIVESVSQVNEFQKELFIKKIEKKFNYDLNKKTFAVWGLAFKPKTNDMREAPSITILNELISKGANIKAYDPKAMENAKNIFGKKIQYSNSSYEALESADALILLTEWNEFRYPDFDKVKSILKAPVIFDGRNQYNPTFMKNKGFEYFCMGR